MVSGSGRTESAAASRIQRGLKERAGWWDRVLELPLLWAVLAVATCAWLVMPRIGSRLPAWEAGQVATYDIVVTHDMTVPDQTATEALREQAQTEVLPVYDLAPGLGTEMVDAIRATFAVCRVELKQGELTQENLGSVSDLTIDAEMVKVLHSDQCSGELEKAVVDVVQQIYHQHVVDDRRMLERRVGEGLVMRNLASSTERTLAISDLSSVIDLRSELEPAIRAHLLEHDAVKRRWIKPITAWLEANLSPDLVFNRAETEARVKAAAAAVTPRMQIFKKGQVIVRRGDTVTQAVARALREMNERRQELTSYATIAGIVLVVLLIVGGWWCLLRWSGPAVEWRHRLSIVFLLLVVFTAAERMGLFLANAVALNSQSSILSSQDAYLWALPHAAGPVAALMVLGLQPAILFSVSQALLVGLMMGGDVSVVIYALAAGAIGILAAQRFKQRAVLTRVGAVVGVANLLVMGVVELYRGVPDGIGPYALGAVCALLGGPLAMGTATFFLPIFEGLFGVTTDLRLLELSSQNLPLLKRLSLEAPGTHQHSLAVGNLAEAGADAVNANGLLLRVCAYYHDVGKLVKPGYFVENQHGVNPHDSIAPSMSALVIMSHVKEGLEMARREKLPLPIRQAIATHHGTKLIRYFYSKATAENAAREREGGEVRESDYRYPGPKPHTKELGILLLADAVEAAARTLDNPTPGKIRNMVERIVSDALADGQLDHSELTFKELEKISSAFLWVLTNMYHSRIDYPGFDFNRRQPKRDPGAHQVGS
jgi:cyclic-di-AMP phosphodiesterase PgpH